jgi:hypothetical protein
MTRKSIQMLLTLVILSLLVGGSLASAASPDTRISESIATLREMADEPDAKAMASLLQRGKGCGHLSVGGQGRCFARVASMEKGWLSKEILRHRHLVWP